MTLSVGNFASVRKGFVESVGNNPPIRHQRKPDVKFTGRRNFHGYHPEQRSIHDKLQAWGAEGEREVRGKSLASSFIVMDERERRKKGDPGKEGRNLLGATADEIYMGASNSGGPDEMKNGARTGTLVAMIAVKTKFPGMKKDWIEFSFDSFTPYYPGGSLRLRVTQQIVPDDDDRHPAGAIFF
ncbi:hypothetical protein R1sor_016281 [Riccia sorocarpa]|uniref:Uncharacterized protein n=1 Tax=Riccia sorocarpa TaxID=122646 RepID=A0ABD3HEK5_9MARC